MVFFGSFSSHVHITLRVNIFCPQKNTSIVTTLTHFFVLHCHLSLRVPTSEMVISCKPGKCVLSCERERSFPRDSTDTRRRRKLSHLSTGRGSVVCAEIPSHGRRAGDKQKRRAWWSAHTAQQMGVPPAVVCSG